MVKKTIEQFLDKTKKVTVYIPKTTGCFFVKVGETTMKFRSKKTSPIEPTGDLPENDVFVHTFEEGSTAIDGMIALIGFYIGKHQNIKIKGCNTAR